jgi:hypothetical protein
LHENFIEVKEAKTSRLSAYIFLFQVNASWHNQLTHLVKTTLPGINLPSESFTFLDMDETLQESKGPFSEPCTAGVLILHTKISWFMFCVSLALSLMISSSTLLVVVPFKVIIHNHLANKRRDWQITIPINPPAGI